MAGPELTVVTPVYNEEANIAAVIGDWLEVFAREGVACRLLTINDGSTDATLSTLGHLQSRFPEQLMIIDKLNSGHGRACRAGYEAALRVGSPWILQIDSDGQCDPAFFPQFWAKREQADCIFGVRVARDDGLSRRWISVACRRLIALVTGYDLKDPNVPYRLIARAALEQALHRVPKEFELQNIALALALKRNSALRWDYVPIRFRARHAGASHMSLPKIARLGLQMLRQIHTVAE
jgi:dolichol-phosphate mannosyltransferase